MRLEPRHHYRCDVCGFEGQWGDTRNGKSWTSYGSIITDEHGMSAHLCSTACMQEFHARLTRGDVKMPVIKLQGYTSTVKSPPVGYGEWA